MGKCYFSDEWLHKDEYISWLSKDNKSRHHAVCNICQKRFDVGNMGEHAVKSHAKSATHKKRLEAVQSSETRITPVIADYFTLSRSV